MARVLYFMGAFGKFGIRNSEFGIVVADLPPLFLLRSPRKGSRAVKGKELL